MNLPECRTWKCGCYTVHATLRRDNPAFLRYVIVRNHKVIGSSFSVPDRAWCDAIERFAALGRYVETPAPVKRYDYRLKKRKA